MSEAAQQRLIVLQGLLALLLLAIIAEWQQATLDLLVLLLACAVAMRIGFAVRQCVLACAALLLSLLTVAAAAESALEHFFARPLELKYDLFLLPAVWDLLEDTGGTAVAIAGLVLMVLLLAGLGRVFAALLRRSVQALPPALAVPITAAAALAYLALVPVSSASLGIVAGIRDAQRVARGEDGFELALAEARRELLELPTDLTLLNGQDFVLFFIESYGRLLWDDQALRGDFLQTLSAAEEEFVAGGYLVSSRFLRSSSFGGSSWLAHMSFMSGVRCRNPVHWQRLLASKVRPLPDYFRARGYQTVSVMPAMDITSWPEGDYFGFTRNVWARELAYAGPRYAWSPMPDQYVLLRLQELVFDSGTAPVFVDVAMTSSHAPYTQIPALHSGDWNHEALAATLALRKPKRGPQVLEGITPEQYARSIDYSLASVTRFMVRNYRRDGVVFVLGDHQPTMNVHRVNPKTLGHFHDVPLHVLTRDPVVHQRLLERGFTPGMKPDEAVASLPMEAMKSFILHLLHMPEGAGS